MFFLFKHNLFNRLRCAYFGVCRIITVQNVWRDITVIYLMCIFWIQTWKYLLTNLGFSLETPCSVEPCFYNGTCTVLGSSFNCACNEGYNGSKCEGC